jgi:hypothetical protein
VWFWFRFWAGAGADAGVLDSGDGEEAKMADLGLVVVVFTDDTAAIGDAPLTKGLLRRCDTLFALNDMASVCVRATVCASTRVEVVGDVVVIWQEDGDACTAQCNQRAKQRKYTMQKEIAELVNR